MTYLEHCQSTISLQSTVPSNPGMENENIVTSAHRQETYSLLAFKKALNTWIVQDVLLMVHDGGRKEKPRHVL